MRTIVVGLGEQGHNRLTVAANDVVGTVDPVVEEAVYRKVEEVPLGSYEAALVCTPDEVKPELLRHLLGNGKHVLVEKPLLASREAILDELEAQARDNGVVCYTAYNHRFEPHFMRMRQVLESGELGKVYAIRMFYGNGTARLVRESPWRDHGAGVLSDLGSHLLDTVDFWLGGLPDGFEVVFANRFENLAPDHVLVAARGLPFIELEMTFLSWRDHFSADVIAERGSAHIASLCKWGASTFTLRRRVLPVGRPKEEVSVLEQPDPTWAAEYAHFKALCEAGGPSNMANDRRLNKVLGKLARTVPGVNL